MADAGKVLFHLTDDALIVANSGEPFTREGVIAVCHMHLSEKTGKPEDNYDKVDLIRGIADSVINEYRGYPNRLAEDAGGEEELGNDYNGRSIWELLQNADDAATVAALGGKGVSGELIGAKGLGFKSILEFSESPEIYSGKFRFCFSREDTQKILSREKIQVRIDAPIFRIPHPCRPDGKCASLLDDGYATVIRLPFISGKAEKAEERLNELDASCLLFCQRLSRIEIKIRGKSRVIKIDRDNIFGFENEKATFTLKENGAAQKWIRWSAAWTSESADSAAPGNRLSAALCLPADKDGKAVASEKERLMHVFFPTSEKLQGLMALMHASYRLEINRKHLLETDKQPDSPAIREKFRGLTANILKEIPASAALRAFGEIPAVKGKEAKSEIGQLQNVFSDAVAQTPFVPVIGEGKVKPAEARIWRHRLGEVLRENDLGVREAKLLAPSLSAESDIRGILTNLGVKHISPHEHAELLRACQNDTLTECHAAWKVAGDIAREANEKKEMDAVLVDALKDAPIWWTDADNSRSFNGDIPLLQKRPKPQEWPNWLKADALSPEFRKLLADKASTNHDSLKDAAVLPLHNPQSYFTGALLPFCKGRDSEWWEKMGWDVLQWAIRWGGDKVNRTDESESIIHLPTDKGWLPAIQCYAGKDWGGPASFDKYFRKVEGRGVLLPMKEWKLPRGAEGDKNKWGEFLHELCVSWTPKVCTRNLAQLRKNFPPPLLEKYAEECLRQAKRRHSSADRIIECEGNVIEHFPGSLTECGAAQTLCAVKDVYQLAKEQGRVTYRYSYGNGNIPAQSFALFQLRQSEWVPCSPGLSDSVGKRKTVAVRPEDAFMPECGLGGVGVVPVVRKPDAFSPVEWGMVYGVLEELGVRTSVPLSQDKEWWRAQMSKLAEIVKELGGENEELRHGRDAHGRMSVVILRLYGVYGDSLANMGDVPHLVKTDNGEFIHFGPFEDVYWADMHYHEDADVRRNLLDKGFKLFPFFLRKGKRFGINPLSGFIGESPEAKESREETKEIRRRFERRREMLALAAGKPKDHFNFGDKISGNSALALILTRKDDGTEIARPEVDFYMAGEGKLLINAGGNKWRALAAGVAAWCKLPERAPAFELLLCEAENEKGDDECRKRLRQQGISESDIAPLVIESGDEAADNVPPITEDESNPLSGGESPTDEISNGIKAETNGRESSPDPVKDGGGKGRSANNGRKAGNGYGNGKQKTGGGAPDPEQVKQVEIAAVDAVTKYYEGGGKYRVVSVEDQRKGWDLEVFRRGESGEKIWNVEVKGISDNKISVRLTSNEYEKSGDDMYRLAVVRNASDGDALACAIYKREGDKWRLKEGSDKKAPEQLVMETSATVKEGRTR